MLFLIYILIPSLWFLCVDIGMIILLFLKPNKMIKKSIKIISIVNIVLTGILFFRSLFGKFHKKTILIFLLIIAYVLCLLNQKRFVVVLFLCLNILFKLGIIIAMLNEPKY